MAARQRVPSPERPPHPAAARTPQRDTSAGAGSTLTRPGRASDLPPAGTRAAADRKDTHQMAGVPTHTDGDCAPAPVFNASAARPFQHCWEDRDSQSSAASPPRLALTSHDSG
jgi:hypothetical protein